MKQVIVYQWCDICKAEDVDTEVAWEGVLTVEDVTRTLELCADHREEIVTTFKNILEQFGTVVVPNQRPEKAPPVPLSATILCPACQAPLSSRKSLNGHAKIKHGKTITELETELGLPVSAGTKTGTREPMISEDGRRLFGPCGVILDDGSACPFTAVAPQGLGAHRKSVHGVEGKWKHINSNGDQPVLATG